MVIARSMFVVRTQRITCDIRDFVCRGEKWYFFQLFFFNKRRKLCSKIVINVLNNKTIILLNLEEYRLILANSAYGLRPRWLSIRRYSARFRRIIVKYSYSQYWTGTSFQWRLMQGNLFKCKYIPPH